MYIVQYKVLLRVSVVAIKHFSQKQLVEEKGLFPFRVGIYPWGKSR